MAPSATVRARPRRPPAPRALYHLLTCTLPSWSRACESHRQSGLNGSFQDMLAAAGVDVDGLNLDGAPAPRLRPASADPC